MLSGSEPMMAGAGSEPGFRGLICVSFGSTDGTANYETGGRPRLDLRFQSATSQALSDLKVALGRSRVGARLILAGPPADIHAAVDATLIFSLKYPRPENAHVDGTSKRHA